jgi:E3 ubiquitin-protein ligase UBR7
VSMLEVLQDEEALEEDAAAVLGATSDSECSFSKGYVARQPLYACPSKVSSETPGGVCLACCLNCHEGQQLVELYTKRNFRCDCGTPRIGNKCTLDQVGKEKENQLNKYNQNFRGLYCICNRPYPDPESTVDDCMIQCVVCEDWFHGRHLGREGGPPGDSEYAEMICEGCVKLYPFLLHYARLDVTLAANESKPVDVVSVEDSDDRIEVKDNIKEFSNSSEKIDESENVENVCKLTSPLPSTVPTSLFLPAGWRAKLCLCPSCDQLYKDKGVSYLCDETDTVHHYEAQVKDEALDMFLFPL